MSLNGISGNGGINPLFGNMGSSHVGKTVQTEQSQPLLSFKSTKDITNLNGPENVSGKTAVEVAKNKEIANDTNIIMKSLGYNYKVTPAQVASISQGMTNVVQPGMTLAVNGAVAANIQNPDGPFAELFT